MIWHLKSGFQLGRSSLKDRKKRGLSNKPKELPSLITAVAAALSIASRSYLEIVSIPDWVSFFWVISGSEGNVFWAKFSIVGVFKGA